ncbi:MAG TPA: hypothetical protein DF712_04240 [Balneola sp.]|jgi:hypothetical protein|nr:hypothetical protein [Bacteroidota bacterium]MAC05917.1 hypothetical protein [Balneola sp.]MAO77442.1 hypothetical protein [Balneola sp.]MBF65400.1 hypothetical protein [Balneola sp.]HAH50282.1 hypothetical protein [Balneola sp.]|tara:strand:+ start:4504 stop:4974 length:471 start_codon:yes stop_codon:yes gene_type:complete
MKMKKYLLLFSFFILGTATLNAQKVYRTYIDLGYMHVDDVDSYFKFGFSDHGGYTTTLNFELQILIPTAGSWPDEGGFLIGIPLQLHNSGSTYIVLSPRIGSRSVELIGDDRSTYGAIFEGGLGFYFNKALGLNFGVGYDSIKEQEYVSAHIGIAF